MPNSYEHSYQHDLDNVIDASDAVLAIGTEKVDTTTLKDRSLTGNDATIHGAMPSNGYFLGRTFDGDDDYLVTNGFVSTSECATLRSLVKYKENIPISSNALLYKANTGIEHFIDHTGHIVVFIQNDVPWHNVLNSSIFNDWDRVHLVETIYNGINVKIFRDGVLINTSGSETGEISSASTLRIGIGSGSEYINGNIVYSEYAENADGSIFNTIARLPLYSHNFERYPNSDTSLTSVFPYTSGIITSGSFNKTDGLKCTSAGQIIFSNSFEFDGSEYITLTIDGVEYSGTTTVTQGTITATIAQGSNDITIDMGTGDILPDIRVQFREEV